MQIKKRIAVGPSGAAPTDVNKSRLQKIKNGSSSSDEQIFDVCLQPDSFKFKSETKSDVCVCMKPTTENDVSYSTSHPSDMSEQLNDDSMIPNVLNLSGTGLNMLKYSSGGKTQQFVKLIGERPVINFSVNNTQYQGLWDTGSMVSLVNSCWVRAHLPDLEVMPVSEFSDTNITLRAANQTNLNIKGVALIDFSLPKLNFSVKTPFLVTDETLSAPIIGYNLICFITQQCSSDGIQEIISNTFPAAIGDPEGFVNLIHAKNVPQSPKHDVWVEDTMTIDPGTVGFIPCRTEASKLKENLFEISPDIELDMPNVILPQPEKNRTYIPFWNRGLREITLFEGSCIGHVAAVESIVPVELENIKVEEEPVSIDDVDLAHLTREQQDAVREVLKEYRDVFSNNSFDLGTIKDFKFTIDLADPTPVSQPYRRLPRKLYGEVKSFVDHLIVNGWIQRSCSAYSSPIVCARKPDGSLRMCVDYRELNRKTLPDSMPIPRVQDILDRLGGMQWFTTLDLTKAYHQGEMDEASRPFTAFATPYGLYEWLRIPMGLKNAPPKFQRKVNEIFEKEIGEVCETYLDDILTYGRTFEDALRNLRGVLHKCRESGIKLNPKKCKFFKESLKYLGKIISKDGYKDDPITTEAIEKLKKDPSTIGELRKLLGYLGWYRGSIKNYARKVKPLYDLIIIDAAQDAKKRSKKTAGQRKSKEPITWKSEHRKIVNELLELLKSPPIMGYPDFTEPFVVHCDASEIGLGGVLYQKREKQKNLTVIAYASRTLSPAEKNYYLHSGKLEFLALKWALCDKFDDYLYCSKPFLVYTDNNPLCYILSTAKLNATGMRWLNNLTRFNFTIKYRPGRISVDCDYLSRHPEFDEFTEEIKGNELQAFKENSLENANLTLTVNELFIEDTQCKRVSKEELQLMQKQDDIVGLIYHYIKDNIKLIIIQQKSLKKKQKQLLRFFKELRIENGILIKQTKSYKQIVLPSCYHQLIYDQLHVNMGHLGVAKVYELARDRFYWPGMYTDINNFITKKCRCVIDKRPTKTPLAPLQPIESTSPFELVCIDFLHLDKCKGNYEYVLVVTDHFTRFSQAYATKNKSALAAADVIFKNYILTFGFPEKIHHDQGREFNNKLWKRLHELSGIDASNTTPYHPMGNGQCERMNRTLINMLRTLEAEKKSNWKDHLKTLMFAYNSMPCQATKHSPHFLMFGRESRLPIDDMFRIKNDNHQFVKKWKEALIDARRIAECSNKDRKRRYDKKVCGSKIVVGDKVLVKNTRPKGTGKLESFWEENIYTVIKESTNCPVFVVKGQSGKERKLHRNLLMKCDLVPLQKKKDVEIQRVPKGPTITEVDEDSSESDDDIRRGIYLRQRQTTSNRRQGTPAIRAQCDPIDKTLQEVSTQNKVGNIPVETSEEEVEQTRLKRNRRAPHRLTYDSKFNPTF